MREHEWIELGVRSGAIVYSCAHCPAIRELRIGTSTSWYRRTWLEPLIRKSPKCVKIADAKQYTKEDLE